MAKPIMGMIPPGGWHYFDGDAKLTAHTYDALIALVESFRAENHRPVGDVAGDVNSYICSNWPTFCHGVDMVVVTSVRPQTASGELMNDIQTWAKNILNIQRIKPFVLDSEAEERAKICRACPKNTNWRGGCSSCITATDRMSANVRQGRDTKSSAVLGGCTVYRHDNRTAIFLDREMFEASNNAPANCWVK